MYVCVCVCVCMYVCMNVCKYVYMYVCMYVCMYVWIHVTMQGYVFKNMYVGVLVEISKLYSYMLGSASYMS